MTESSTVTTENAVLLSDLFPEEIAERVGIKPFQGRQIFRWIHRKRIFDFDEMTNLSKELRGRLRESFRAGGLSPIRFSQSSSTSTRKALLALPDGETVESVHIPARDRMTFCLSSQVGCPIKCSFCATGLSGFARNLSPGEIVEQALYLLSEQEDEGRSPNVVYMGMGEPFSNYDAVMKSLRLLMHPEGLGIGARRITVSTVGDVAGIERFANEGLQVRLSVSLHSADDATRDVLVPLNRRYPLERLSAAVDSYLRATGRQITFEWTLMEGINDSLVHAEELVTFIGGRQIHVNLIPYNPVAGVDYRAPTRSVSRGFCEKLESLGVGATLRLERGQDINAACGQLRRQASGAASGQ